MKKISILKLLVVIALIFQSCTNEEEKLDIKSSDYNQNFISYDEANKIASEIQSSNIVGYKGKIKFNEVKTISEILDDNGLTVYYIINYKNDSFIILSADNRVDPILAYSNSKNFELKDLESYPMGLQFWMEDKKTS